MLMTGTTHRGRLGRIASYIAWPFRELILVYRDRRSPEKYPGEFNDEEA
jgi:hypothetical protein